MQLVMIEIFKSINNSNPTFTRDLFPIREQRYSLRNASRFQLSKVQTKAHDIETVSLLGSSLWNTLLNKWKTFKLYKLIQKKDKAMGVDAHAIAGFVKLMKQILVLLINYLSFHITL